jgi:small acid-soluble spore protein E (minor gamma-type SASP)
MTNKNSDSSRTNAQQVRRQNQQSQQGMSEEFASETDVNEVRRQNQQSQANKGNGSRANQFNNETE